MSLNLQDCVKALRWNRQLPAPVFAKELGISTRDYNRFEEGKLDTDTLLAVLRWLFVDPDAPAVKPHSDDATPAS